MILFFFTTATERPITPDRCIISLMQVSAFSACAKLFCVQLNKTRKNAAVSFNGMMDFLRMNYKYKKQCIFIKQNLIYSMEALKQQLRCKLFYPDSFVSC